MKNVWIAVKNIWRFGGEPWLSARLFLALMLVQGLALLYFQHEQQERLTTCLMNCNANDGRVVAASITGSNMCYCELLNGDVVKEDR